jgi:hypothetical protein
MDVKKWRGKKFDEALERLLETDAAGMFKGIHRANEILEYHKIQNPIPSKTMLDLGIAVGAIQMMQECKPDKSQEVSPELTAAILLGFLRAVFYFRMPIGERVDDLICREDNKLYWAISAALGPEEGRPL